MSKPLLVVQDNQLKRLQADEPETGMGFYFIQTPSGLLAVLSDGAALPFDQSPLYFDFSDLLAGTPVPRERVAAAVTLGPSVGSRAATSVALLALSISPHYAGSAKAFPLLGSLTLLSNTTFCRYLRSPTDHRFAGGKLSAGTYLTTQLDATYANSGFAAVGRFALPLPLPASHVIRYAIPAHKVLAIGTVAPLFGQAGGGVEVRLTGSEPARVVGTSPLPAF